MYNESSSNGCIFTSHIHNETWPYKRISLLYPCTCTRYIVFYLCIKNRLSPPLRCGPPSFMESPIATQKRPIIHHLLYQVCRSLILRDIVCPFFDNNSKCYGYIIGRKDAPVKRPVEMYLFLICGVDMECEICFSIRGR